MLAHGAVLRKNGFSSEQLEAIARDYHEAGLSEKEVAMMDYARKVVREASSTTAEDFNRLRGLGWTDEDILSITLAAAARAFASKVFDALHADPDPFYKDLDEETHHALIGKRPFTG
jgi:alkylhydroperoxidase family enzyme